MPSPSLRARVEECLVKVESGEGDEARAVMDLIIAICTYYRELVLESAGI